MAPAFGSARCGAGRSGAASVAYGEVAPRYEVRDQAASQVAVWCEEVWDRAALQLWCRTRWRCEVRCLTRWCRNVRWARRRHSGRAAEQCAVSTAVAYAAQGQPFLAAEPAAQDVEQVLRAAAPRTWSRWSLCRCTCGQQ